jgi:type II secretory pathway component PulK
VVLVLIFVLVIAITAFQRRAIIDTTIATNRLRAAEADSLARGGQRLAAAMVYVIHLKQRASSTGLDTDDRPPIQSSLPVESIPMDEIWARMGDYEVDVGNDRSLRITIEDEGARLNLNALVPQVVRTEGEGEDASTTTITNDTTSADAEEAENYLKEVLDYIIDGIDQTAGAKTYDTRAIARNLLDYMDADSDSKTGRSEDTYYREQDPPYLPRNGPFLTVDEIGLVEGVDARLLEAMRHYVTVHPIGSTVGINLNRAKPWVLSIVYSGIGGNRDFIGEAAVRDILALRETSKILCDDLGSDPSRCVSLGEVGNRELSEGSIYPKSPLPAEVSVFRVVAEARVGNLTRRIEAIYDTRSFAGPQLLSWRRLRGPG